MIDPTATFVIDTVKIASLRDGSQEVAEKRTLAGMPILDGYYGHAPIQTFHDVLNAEVDWADFFPWLPVSRFPYVPYVPYVRPLSTLNDMFPVDFVPESHVPLLEIYTDAKDSARNWANKHGYPISLPTLEELEEWETVRLPKLKEESDPHDQLLFHLNPNEGIPSE